MSQTHKQVIGSWGEQEACVFLQNQGYSVIERNFRTRFGEIDIIAWHDKPHFGKTLCFIEVKTRSEDEGSAERATNAKKLQHLFSAARAFCVKKDFRIDTTPIQFEQVSVYGINQDMKGIKHYIIPVE